MGALFYGLALLAGLSNPLQSAANAALNKGFKQPLAAAVVVYAVALAGLALCVLAGWVFFGTTVRGMAGRLTTLPPWAFLGGLCQLTFTLAAAVATQRIGSAAFTVTVLVVAVALSVVLDAYGLMGLPLHPASWPRLLGAALAIVGVVLVSAF